MVRRPVPSNRIKKIFLASNSQGTSAGIPRELNYPSQLQSMLGKDFDVHRMLISGWTLRDFVKTVPDNVLPLNPDFVVMNFGIIEASQRILSNWEKKFLSLVPGGPRVTGMLHRNRARVLMLRHSLGLATRQETVMDYSASVRDAADCLVEKNIKYLFLKIPTFQDQGKTLGNPYINNDIELFNSALDEYPSLLFESFEGGWSMSDFQDGTVHFSVAGQRKIAENIKSYIMDKLVEQ